LYATNLVLHFKTYGQKLLVLTIAGGILALLLAKIGALLYFDPRPFTHPGVVSIIPHAPDNGFPSDHELLASVLAISTYVYFKLAGLLFGILAIVIGAARVLAHVHSPIDVIGSMLIAALAVTSTLVLLKKLTISRELV